MKYTDIIQDYKEYLLAEKGYSKNTIKEYNRDIINFFDYVNNIDIEDVENIHVSKFLNHLITDRGISSSTRNRRLFSIRSFYKYLVKYNCVKNNPTNEIDCAKTVKNKEPIYLKYKQIEALLLQIKKDNTCNAIRNMAITKLFLYTGLRLFELVSLNINDIDLDNKQIKITGKGNKERIIPLHKEAIKSIKNYLYNRDDNINALFISTRNNRISKRQVQRMIKKYMLKTGVKNKEKITPHKLRHTFATMIYKKNKDLKVLQDLLGHESISTTEIYMHIDKEDKKKNVNSIPVF
jgi:integrase/recombinase XerC